MVVLSLGIPVEVPCDYGYILVFRGRAFVYMFENVVENSGPVASAWYVNVDTSYSHSLVLASDLSGVSGCNDGGLSYILVS